MSCAAGVSVNFFRFEELFEKYRIRDGLEWTVDPTTEIKLRFQVSQAWCSWSLKELINV